MASKLQQGTLQVLLPDYSPPEIVICAIYPANRHLSAKVMLFAEFLQKRFGKQGFEPKLLA